MDATGTLWERGEWLVPLVTVGGTHVVGLTCGALPQFIENEMDKEAINGAHRMEGRAPRWDDAVLAILLVIRSRRRPGAGLMGLGYFMRASRSLSISW